MALSLTKCHQNKIDSSEYYNNILDCFSKSYFNDSNGRNNTFRNERVADAHSRFLSRLKRYDEALKICEKGLNLAPHDVRLNSLYGNIMKTIDPNYVSETGISNLKRGVFSGIDTETAKSF